MSYDKTCKITSLNGLNHVHLIGICGIGMSSIAQFLKDCNLKVTGSDRGVNNPENSRIFNALKSQGIMIFPQDGSFCQSSEPDILIYSTAIEEDNPDFLAAPKIPRIHRSEMLALCIASINDKFSIAVSGSCGKTTVTAWLTETLFNSGHEPTMIGGGLSNRFTNKTFAGNFKAGKGDYLVFEADESDKSLLNYNPDYALILNIGTDHYSEAELVEVFRKFLNNIQKGAVVSRQVYELLGKQAFSGLDIIIFDDKRLTNPPLKDVKQWYMEEYSNGKAGFFQNRADKFQKLELKLPVPGYHSGLNALAILSMMNLLGLLDHSTTSCIEDYKGVWRRFDFAGTNSNGAKIYDDYAHNVEKILSCIKTAREVGDRVIAVFQPHGYKPLEFMRDALFDSLEATLSEKDIFCFLPVYYAGGSSSFSPTSEEVVDSYIKKGEKHYMMFSRREKLKKYVAKNATENDTIIVMGARDNSLSVFVTELACANQK